MTHIKDTIRDMQNLSSNELLSDAWQLSVHMAIRYLTAYEKMLNDGEQAPFTTVPAEKVTSGYTDPKFPLEPGAFEGQYIPNERSRSTISTREYRRLLDRMEPPSEHGRIAFIYDEWRFDVEDNTYRHITNAYPRMTDTEYGKARQLGYFHG